MHFARRSEKLKTEGKILHERFRNIHSTVDVHVGDHLGHLEAQCTSNRIRKIKFLKGKI